MKQLQALLFKQNQKQAVEKVKKKIHARYRETGDTIKVGSKVLMRKNHQVGEVKEIRGRNAILQVGLMPITVAIDDLVVVQVKAEDENSRTGRE
jgi:DNA mismatch repair protein MutS2